MNRNRLFLILCLCFLATALVSSVAAGEVCKYCQKEIGSSKAITAEGAFYHAEHFLCSHCDQPITGGRYYIVNGELYDSACYVAQVTGYCDYCRKPISGEWYETEEGRFHKSCMREHVAPRCLVCDEPLIGIRYTDGLGGYVCEEHLMEIDRCHSCQRFVKEGRTPGLAQFEDERYICPKCLATAVVDLDQAERLMSDVRRQMARLGIEITEQIEFQLVDQDQLRKQSNGYAQDPLGVTLYRKQMMLGGLLSFQDFRVLTLTGLPEVHLKAVMAHELMHVWMFANAGDDHEPTLCEGSCEYAAYLVLSNDRSEQGEFYRNHLLNNDDPTYGLGLKRVTELVERIGIEGWLEYLKSNNVGPWQASADY